MTPDFDGSDLSIPAADDEDMRIALMRLSVEELLALLLMVFLCLLVFAQFALRYLTNYSIPWGEEGARALLILIVFAGTSAAVHRKAHIAADLWEARASTPRALISLRNAICALFFGYSGWLAWEAANRVWLSSMASLPISRGWIFLFVAIFMGMAALRAAVHLFAGVREKEAA
ncbi:MAG: TRAP transporter small permease, partial [Henriciella sp.]|uniref:TRAP transporter small permease n=1 Tax=Henriciella sp. TaxID=1968823 RepID=UPI003C751624